MKYQLVAENAIEENVLQSHLAVKPLFDAFLPVLQARSIMAAVRFGIFDAIGKKALSAKQLASTLALDEQSLNFMLRVLTCAGYVKKEGEKFALTDVSQATCMPGNPITLTNWINYNYFHWDVISQMEQVLKTGKGINAHRHLEENFDWEIYQRAMFETARPAAPMVAEYIPVKSNAAKLLDAGGSHGYYGAMICRKHPPMRATVLDLSNAIKHASKIAEEEKYKDVVEYKAGDILKNEFTYGYDVAFLGNITHHFTPDQNQLVIQKIKSALTQDGTIAIWDFRRPDANSQPELIGDGLAWFFRLTSATQCYSVADYSSWLETAGFAEIQVHPAAAPAQVLITGRNM